MTGKADQMKGQAKEVVGDLTGNKDLKSDPDIATALVTAVRLTRKVLLCLRRCRC
jgi:hypothetical protein